MFRAMKVTYFPCPADFRRWLEDHHTTGKELWVGLYKKASGRPSITYSEAVEEALCFGWIDGVRRSVEPTAYTIRFTPRRPNSQWSAVNLKRVERLSAERRMHAAGLRAFAGATEQERRYSFEQQRESRLSPADEHRFRRNRKAWDYFQAQPPWYRRSATFWVVSAKKQDTRERRLSTLIADSEAAKAIKPLTRPVPKRPKKSR